MSERGRFPRSILGRGFPEGFVAGLVEAHAAVRARQALTGAGLGPEDVRTFPGEWALEIDATHHPSLALRPPVPGEEAASEEFLAGALLGDVLIGVRAESDVRARDVTRILLGADVGCVQHFGPGSLHRSADLSGSTARW